MGVWENDRFIGCVLFSRGASDSIAKPFGLKQTQVAELTRVALDEHQNSVSRILSIAVKFVRRRSPGVILLVSYADPAQDHHGGIYQASNWLYLGKSASDTAYIGPDGKRWHSRMISSTGYKKVYGARRRVWKPSECRAIKVPGKHKYVYPLDKELRERLAQLAMPYPKPCAGSVEGDTSAIHVEEGGSIPTPAL